MCLRQPIHRVALKIRKPILVDLCTCYNNQIITIDGDPGYIVGDGMTVNELRNMLDSMDICTSLYFSQPLKDCSSKVLLALSYKIPVVLKTDEVVPMYILEAMKEVPHCSLHVSIKFLEQFPGNPLEACRERIESLRKMVHLAKSWKIFSVLCLDYDPTLVKKLDVFEIVEMMKMHVGHCLVKLTKTDLIINSKVFADLCQFVSYKKLSLSELPEIPKEHKIRWHSNNTTFGLRLFTYTKNKGVFEEYHGVVSCTCGKCGKVIL